MKAVCIIGSPRSNGNTAAIADQVIAGMKSQGIDVTRYCLGDLTIHYCLGCKHCYETGRCIQHDDVDVIMNDLLESEIVLIASPSYWGDVTGQLKVFFDRNTPYCDTHANHSPIPPGKVGIAIAIRAGQTRKENLHILESIEHYFGHLGIKAAARFSVESLDESGDLANKQNELAEAYKLGATIFKLCDSPL